MKTKRRFLYLVLFSLPVLLFSCKDKDETEELRNAIVGTWQLSSVQRDGVDVDLTAFPDIIQFQPNYIFLSYATSTQVKVRGGWSYDGDMLNISVYLPAAFYVLKADALSLSLKRLDFNTGGTLTTTIQEYRRTSESITN
jgi:hypothetical protein